MKNLAFIFCILITAIGYSQVENYSVKFDQLLLRLNNNSKIEAQTNPEFYLGQIDNLWPNVKNKLYGEVDWNKNQNSLIRDIDLNIKILKRSIEIQNFEFTEAVTNKILWKLKELRFSMGQTDYPIDLLIILQKKYKNIHKAVHDQKLDLLEWMQFQDMVNRFVDDWEQYNCLAIEEIELQFPNINKDQHEIFKNNFMNCLDTFIESLQSGYRTDFELPCDDLGDALFSLSSLYQMNFSKRQKL